MKHVSITSNAQGMLRSLKRGLEQNAQEAAEHWREGIVEVMAESEKSGKRYYYTGLGWTRASLPGRPPAIQTGEYARSIAVRDAGEDQWAVGSPLERGAWLQFGTENMAPRPHIREGYYRKEREIEAALGGNLDEGGALR